MNAEQKEYALQRDREIAAATIKALELQLDKYEVRIAELEAMLRNYETALAESDKQRADSVGEVVRAHERIAALEAELAPWREMARQVEALRGAGHTMQLAPDKKGKGPYIVQVGKFDVLDNPIHWTVPVTGYGDTLPAAVAAAYEQVKGVGDE